MTFIKLFLEHHRGKERIMLFAPVTKFSIEMLFLNKSKDVQQYDLDFDQENAFTCVSISGSEDKD